MQKRLLALICIIAFLFIGYGQVWAGDVNNGLQALNRANFGKVFNPNEKFFWEEPTDHNFTFYYPIPQTQPDMDGMQLMITVKAFNSQSGQWDQWVYEPIEWQLKRLNGVDFAVAQYQTPEMAQSPEYTDWRYRTWGENHKYPASDPMDKHWLWILQKDKNTHLDDDNDIAYEFMKQKGQKAQTIPRQYAIENPWVNHRDKKS